MDNFSQLTLEYVVLDHLERITVDDCSSRELVESLALAFKLASIRITTLEDIMYRVDFMGDSRGKTYEMYPHRFGRKWNHVDALALMDEKPGFDGNFAASFMYWKLRMPMGLSTSIPRDESRLWRPPGSINLHVPFYTRSDMTRAICLGTTNHWCADCTLLLFREVRRGA